MVGLPLASGMALVVTFVCSDEAYIAARGRDASVVFDPPRYGLERPPGFRVTWAPGCTVMVVLAARERVLRPALVKRGGR